MHYLLESMMSLQNGQNVRAPLHRPPRTRTNVYHDRIRHSGNAYFVSNISQSFVQESVLHSVHERDPDKIDTYAGYYGYDFHL